MNTKFDYMYRDAANYKSFYSFVFEGELSEEQIEKFIDACDDDLFIPRAIGLPGGVLEGEPDYDAELDHYWCEHDFEDSFELTSSKPDSFVINGKATIIRAEEFLELVMRCNNWEAALANPIDVFDLRAEKTTPALEEQIRAAVKQNISNNFLQVGLSKDELDLIKKSLNEMGDRVADREGYSSGEKYWDLKAKLENLEKEHPQGLDNPLTQD